MEIREVAQARNGLRPERAKSITFGIELTEVRYLRDLP